MRVLRALKNQEDSPERSHASGNAGRVPILRVGFDLLETDDAKALAELALMWSDLMI
jgi:hypothetical protein